MSQRIEITKTKKTKMMVMIMNKKRGKGAIMRKEEIKGEREGK